MRPVHRLILAFGLALLWTAPAMAGHFNVVNKLPAANPCKGLKADLYAGLNKAVGDVIKSGVVGDIDKTVDKTLADNKIGDSSTVDIEINIAPDAASYQKAMHDADSTASDEDMQGWFDNDIAHTDIVGKEGHKKIVVYIFCGDHLKTRLIDGNGVRTVIHELVHAQLYSMSIRGLPRDKEPYGETSNQEFAEAQGRNGHADEHNEEFHKIVERLAKLFETEQENQRRRRKKENQRPPTNRRRKPWSRGTAKPQLRKFPRRRTASISPSAFA